MDSWLQLLASHRANVSGGNVTHPDRDTAATALHALTEHRLLTVVGAGAAALLQGQLTCDIHALTGGSATLGAQCNAKGRMLASFLVSPMDNGFVLRVPASQVSGAAAGLAKYAPFYKVAVVASDWVGLAGEALTSANGVQFASPVSRLTECWLPQTAAAPMLEGRALAPASAYAMLELQAGLAEVTPPTSGRYTPHDWHYPELGGVSFQKGCYTGQEIIARMHYRGRGKVALFRGRSTELDLGAEFELETVTCQVVARVDDQLLIAAAAAALPGGHIDTRAGSLWVQGRVLPG